MGAKTAVLIYTDGHPADLLRDAPEPDPAATTALITRTNPGWDGTTTSPGNLDDYIYPDQGMAYAGSFPGIDVLCDQQVMVDRPSELPAHLLHAGAHRGRVILHAMHSVTDWFAYAIWENGNLLRSLSLSPDTGVIENIGTPLEFEQPYWAGEHPVPRTPGSPDETPYALPFHPLELGGEAALRDLLGFIVEGRRRDTDIDAEAVRLLGFPVPVANPITQADVQEFRRTHTFTRYTYGPDGNLAPIEE
ncbi:DUF6928 family protein [Actinomadura roseirufa]|uniref:DUF6928 family protein n=1 Tax=Actinomadura roseirufa TaxID=2094049 RepID=UPI001A9554FE|nr:hypothetical protein [Actinomadura roseirufa]